jgi:hypothetical protein
MFSVQSSSIISHGAARGCGVHSGQFLMCPEFALLLFAWGQGGRASAHGSSSFWGYRREVYSRPLIQLHFCRDVYGLYQLPTCPKKKTNRSWKSLSSCALIFIFFQTHEFPNILECCLFGLASPWSILSWLSVKLWWFCGMRKIADSKLQNFWPYPLNYIYIYNINFK